MIRIMITTAEGTLLGSTTLDTDDFDQNMAQPSVRTKTWIGEKVLAELPSDPVARLKLLEKEGD